MVENLMREGVIRSEEVKRSFLMVPREAFVWRGTESNAYYDSPQPLGVTGQTISAPHMIAIMLEEMNLNPGLKVLEIGAGSGYNAALMGEIVAPSKGGEKGVGRVTSVERVEELVRFASRNLGRAGYSDRVTVVRGDGTLGYPERGTEELYDRIVVTAAAPHVPKYLETQLKRGGLLLIPVGDPFTQVLLRVTKSESGGLVSRSVCECMFVPLVGEDGYR